MAAANNTGIFPPVLPCSQEEFLYSVSITLPAEAEEEVQRYASQAGTSWAAEVVKALTLYSEAESVLPMKTRET